MFCNTAKCFFHERHAVLALRGHLRHKQADRMDGLLIAKLSPLRRPVGSKKRQMWNSSLQDLGPCPAALGVQVLLLQPLSFPDLPSSFLSLDFLLQIAHPRVQGFLPRAATLPPSCLGSAASPLRVLATALDFAAFRLTSCSQVSGAYELPSLLNYRDFQCFLNNFSDRNQVRRRAGTPAGLSVR